MVALLIIWMLQNVCKVPVMGPVEQTQERPKRVPKGRKLDSDAPLKEEKPQRAQKPAQKPAEECRS